MDDEGDDDGDADSAAPRIGLVAEEVDRLFEIVEFVVQIGSPQRRSWPASDFFPGVDAKLDSMSDVFHPALPPPPPPPPPPLRPPATGLRFRASVYLYVRGPALGTESFARRTLHAGERLHHRRVLPLRLSGAAGAQRHRRRAASSPGMGRPRRVLQRRAATFLCRLDLYAADDLPRARFHRPVDHRAERGQRSAAQHRRRHGRVRLVPDLPPRTGAGDLASGRAAVRGGRAALRRGVRVRADRGLHQRRTSATTCWRSWSGWSCG